MASKGGWSSSIRVSVEVGRVGGRGGLMDVEDDRTSDVGRQSSTSTAIISISTRYPQPRTPPEADQDPDEAASNDQQQPAEVRRELV